MSLTVDNRVVRFRGEGIPNLPLSSMCINQVHSLSMYQIKQVLKQSNIQPTLNK
ncbi:hypothetical protein Hanom_Chr05g00438451 [Helianthus anomalus]